jgi:hypothetical protein
MVAGIGSGVGPFCGDGPIEPFGLAVGLRPIGAGAFVGDPGTGEDLPEGERPVSHAVVGQHPLHGHPQAGIERQRTGGEPGHGDPTLVKMGFQVGHPRAVINGHVEEVVADRVLVASTSRRAQNPVPTTVGNAALLLDVQVDQLPGSLPLVRTT